MTSVVLDLNQCEFCIYNILMGYSSLMRYVHGIFYTKYNWYSILMGSVYIYSGAGIPLILCIW